MDFSAGGLTNDQQAGGSCGVHHRTGTVWKMGRAYLASPDVAQELFNGTFLESLRGPDGLSAIGQE